MARQTQKNRQSRRRFGKAGSGGSCQSGSGSYWDASRFNRRYRAVRHFCVVILIAAIAASPFGIFFASEPEPDAVPLNVAISQINMEYSARLAELQEGDYHSIQLHGNPPDWQEVAAVFASHTAGAEDGVDVATLDADRVERLRTTFWDMCSISSEEETIEQPDSDPGDEIDDSWTERILHITISAKTADEMRTAYHFSDYQNEALDALLAEREAMSDLLGNLSISQEEALALLQNLPADLSPERKAVVRHALSLVGKVNYFWGGKSLVLGWDSRWGQLTQVWAAGSQTTEPTGPMGWTVPVSWIGCFITPPAEPMSLAMAAAPMPSIPTAQIFPGARPNQAIWPFIRRTSTLEL